MSKTWLKKHKPGQPKTGFFVKSEPANKGRVYYLGYAWPTGVQVEQRKISNCSYRALKGGLR